MKAIADFKITISAHSGAPTSKPGRINWAYIPEMKHEDLQEIIRYISVQKRLGTDNIGPRNIY